MHLIRISEHWQILLVLVIGFVVTGCEGSKLNSDNGLVSKAEVRLNISSDSDRVVEFPVVVSNVSARDISIVGMRADCSCAQTDLPKIVKAGQSVEIVVRVVVDGLSVREPELRRQVLFVQQQSGSGLLVDLVSVLRKGD